MVIGLARTLSGDWQLVDVDDEDAPLVEIKFHNEAKRLPDAKKQEAANGLLSALKLRTTGAPERTWEESVRAIYALMRTNSHTAETAHLTDGERLARIQAVCFEIISRSE